MHKVKKWYETNKHIAMGAIILGLAWVFLHSVSLAARGSSAPIHHNEVLRLHILANSNSQADQDLKLVLRDGIWQFISKLVNEAATMQEARSIISENLPVIENIANQIIIKNHSRYNVSANLTNLNFPLMSYAGIIFPQGRYEALQIVVGSGQGDNWWCVMFPPMCLMEITQAEVVEVLEDTESVFVRPRFFLAELWGRLFD